ncbi:DNA polymerase III subunit alpha [Sporosarcina pasteurii]|uniref:DNA-directed DNA polymerase n=1 Tax=Sporosarcina pasteurii TaxID=1474 RepID=A0A380C4J3_SPOPA|nr:DNA polymerase III subunit alpha [Sporosarcina pasteurii]MDS9471742.1 DNA polymerase III subunit alpha [Sporosarcina pasteurii]QBQ04660.1 DNA polymerase III subunit alpha [Sporosarcina pasteurii]SUJ12954.1 DNA polymerase III subunit alpha [Sporosarcina pasteurii]
MELIYPQIVTGADLLRGINKLNYVAPLLSRRGATAAAIMNKKMYGVPSFYKTMNKYGIKPIIGLSVMLDVGEEQAVLVYVYAKTNEGFHNLLKMSSAISITTEETLPLHWLQAYSTGCIVLCPMTDATWDGCRDEDTLNLIIRHHQGQETYIGISRPGGGGHAEESHIEILAEATSLQIAAIYESRYVFKEDFFAFKAAQAIRSGEKINELDDQLDVHQFAYLPELGEIQEWFKDRPQWLETMQTILLSCHVELKKNGFLMPKYPLPEGEDAASYLMKKCTEGLLGRIETINPIYKERLDYELTMIQQMEFTDYFLIVEDFIRFATNAGILTGPGRGSSAGSLVAYALGITDVDPIKYGLIFERFLNPERVTMPDIDIDFADNRRLEVIEYVAGKYGKAHVAQIITFGTLSTRAVARNVARVFGFTTEEMNYVAGLISSRSRMTLQKAYDESTELREWIQMEPIRRKWFETALTLEGLPRNASTHAAGVVLAPHPLVNTVPLQDGEDGLYLTQWPMGDVEESGLLKMDFLGLRNLTLLDRIRAMIRFDKGIYLNFEQIPLDDELTYKIFQNGDTIGVFQFESPGMRDTLKLIQPNRFEDIFAINALYRPGPMDHITSYHRRKNGQEQIRYLHPSLEPILRETYGIIVYQEQIMQIAVQVAGYTMGEADLLRRAISKKNRDVLNNEQLKFTERAIANGIPKQSALDIYELIVKFADYGFPKSHAVAYSLISYRLAYLKANEPAYFYAAFLTSLAGNHEKIIEVMREATARGIKFLAPSINKSKFNFTVEKGAVRIGLRTIQGITASFYEQVKKARETSLKWKTMFDCAAALGSENFTEKTATQLIKAGAFDEFGQSRGVLLASIDAAISHALFIGPNEEDLLSSVMQSIANPKYSPSSDIPRMKMLEYEREALGFYLSEHPAVEVKKMLNESFADVIAIDEMRERSNVTIIGLVTEIKRIRTKKGESMAFVKVQDETGVISCTFFPRQYAAFSVQLREMNILHVMGTVERRRGTPQVIVQNMKVVVETV